MPEMNKPRSHAKNGHRWRTISGVAKRKWIRDGAVTCHLCLHTIDLDAPAKSEWSLSVDHKIPVSVRPDLEYTLDNLAPACWQCNVVRQDRPLEEIQSDPALFRREVESAIERRNIRRAKTAARTTANRDMPQHPEWGPSSRNWWSGGPPVESPEAREKRLQAWRDLPHQWRPEVAADRDWL